MSIDELREQRKRLEYEKNNILYVVVKQGRLLLHEQESIELICLHKKILELNKEIKKLANANKKEGETKNAKRTKNSKK